MPESRITYALMGVFAVIGIATVLWVLGHAEDAVKDPWMLLPLVSGFITAASSIGVIIEGEK